MKFNKIFSALMLIAAVAFTACENPEIVGPGPNGGDNDKPQRLLQLPRHVRLQVLWRVKQLQVPSTT